MYGKGATWPGAQCVVVFSQTRQGISPRAKKTIQGSSIMVYASTTTYIRAFFVDEVGSKCVVHDRVEAEL